MKSYQNEIFGPVLQVIEVNEFSEAISIINNNEFGNDVAFLPVSGENARIFQKR